MTLFGLVAPFAGGLILLHGPRKVLTWWAILLIVGLVLAIMMTTRWQLWIALGIAMGVAPGMTALVMAATIATRWFTARRGLALGHPERRTCDGTAHLPDPRGLDRADLWMADGAAALLCLIGLLALLVVLLSRDRPADIGLAPYGEDTVLPAPSPPTGNVFAISIDALRMASGSLVFWVLPSRSSRAACQASASCRIS